MCQKVVVTPCQAVDVILPHRCLIVIIRLIRQQPCPPPSSFSASTTTTQWPRLFDASHFAVCRAPPFILLALLQPCVLEWDFPFLPIAEQLNTLLAIDKWRRLKRWEHFRLFCPLFVLLVGGFFSTNNNSTAVIIVKTKHVAFYDCCLKLRGV